MSTAQLTPRSAPRLQAVPWRPAASQQAPAAPAPPRAPHSAVPAATSAANRSWAGLLAAAVASASVASALIHFAVVPEHWGDYRLAAAFFIALGIFQLVWAAMVVARPSRNLSLAGAAVTLGTIAVWAVSRTTGLPFGPFAHIPEAIGRPDIISTVLEEFVLLGIGVLAFGNAGRRRLDRPSYRAGIWVVSSLAGMVTLWALLAVHLAHGGMASENLVLALGHHGLHLMFAGGAVVVFGMYVVANIRRNGWPTFSWSLHA